MSTINTNLQALTAAMNLDRNQTLLGQSIDVRGSELGPVVTAEHVPVEAVEQEQDDIPDGTHLAHYPQAAAAGKD